MQQLQFIRWRKSLLEKLDKAEIFLDGEHLARLRHEQLGERAESGANLKNFVRSRKLGGVHDAAKLVAIMQKILPERFGELNIAIGQRLFHLREFHASRSPNVDVAARN